MTVLEEDESRNARLMGWLVVSESKEESAGRYFRLQQGVNHVGRLGSRAEVELRDSGASQNHAVLIATNSGYRLVDLDSRNGLLVNDKKTEHVMLQHGDRIKIGFTIMIFVAFNQMAED